MKKSIITIGVLAVLVSTGVYYHASSNEDRDQVSTVGSEIVELNTDANSKTASNRANQEELDQQFGLIPSLTTNDKLPTEQLAYLYFYQPDCSYCQAVEPDVVDFYQDQQVDNQLYRIDLADEANSSIWGDEQSAIGSELEMVGDLKVIGTPTLVTVENGVVTAIASGSDEVQQALTN